MGDDDNAAGRRLGADPRRRRSTGTRPKARLTAQIRHAPDAVHPALRRLSMVQALYHGPKVGREGET